jgi:hypothetical protein
MNCHQPCLYGLQVFALLQVRPAQHGAVVALQAAPFAPQVVVGFFVVGNIVGVLVGVFEGVFVGDLVVGAAVGGKVGGTGASVGKLVGDLVGDMVGFFKGAMVGLLVVGLDVGLSVSVVGLLVVGIADGCAGIIWLVRCHKKRSTTLGRTTLSNKSMGCLTVAVGLKEGEPVGRTVVGFDEGERVGEAESIGALVPLKVTKPIQKRSVDASPFNPKRICKMGP